MYLTQGQNTWSGNFQCAKQKHLGFHQNQVLRQLFSLKTLLLIAEFDVS